MRDRKPENRVLAVVAVLTGLGMAVLPTAGLSILTPWVTQRLALPTSTAALLQTAYPVGLILTALPMAALAARIGPRRGFLAALLALTGLVPAAALPLDFASLAGLRFLGGGACALLLCAGWSLLRRVLGEARLGLGLGLAELAVLPALLLVQISAGFALSSFGSLGILVPALLLAVPSLILGVIALPEVEETRPRFDGLGAVLSALCLGLLLAAAALAAIRPVMALLVLELGLMLSGLWVWQQWRRPAPLLPLDLLARPGLAGPLAAALAGGIALTAVDVALPLHLKALGDLSLESVSGVLLGLACLTAGGGLPRRPVRGAAPRPDRHGADGGRARGPRRTAPGRRGVADPGRRPPRLRDRTRPVHRRQPSRGAAGRAARASPRGGRAARPRGRPRDAVRSALHRRGCPPCSSRPGRSPPGTGWESRRGWR